MYDQIIIALNGQHRGKRADYQTIISENSYLIAADGGALFLEELGFKPDIIIGDLDSLPDEKYHNYDSSGIDIISYPVEKDETDGELAVNYCRDNGYQKIVIIGAAGGRLDQQLANIFLLEYASSNNLEAVIREPDLEMGLISGKKVFKQKKGKILSLIPLDSRVEGLSISGCKYKLDDETLYRFHSRGVSNKIVEDLAVITLRSGLLLYVISQIEK